MNRASVEETAKEKEDCDMRNSGLDRAGLPETESLTSQRSSQGSKTTEGRKGVPRAHADLDGENDVIRWVDTATHTPTTPPHRVSRQAKRVGLGWPERCRRAGSPAGTKRDGARLEWAFRFSLLRQSSGLQVGARFRLIAVIPISNANVVSRRYPPLSGGHVGWQLLQKPVFRAQRCGSASREAPRLPANDRSRDLRTGAIDPQQAFAQPA